MVMLSVVGLAVALVCWWRGLVGAVLESRFVSSLLGRPERALAGLAVAVAVAVAEMDHADGEALLVGIPDRAWSLAAESLESLGERALEVLAADGHPSAVLRFDRSASEDIEVRRASMRTRLIGKPGGGSGKGAGSEALATLSVGADRYPLALHAEEKITLGREPQAGVVSIGDPQISARHAVIEARAGEVWVTDLGSTNGTFLDEEKVARARLGDGDVLRLGDTTISVAIHRLPDGAVHLAGGRPKATPANVRRRQEPAKVTSAGAGTGARTQPLDMLALFAAEDARGEGRVAEEGGFGETAPGRSTVSGGRFPDMAAHRSDPEAGGGAVDLSQREFLRAAAGFDLWRPARRP